MSQPLRNLVYVGDPMCSWCWGFAPEIESLAREHPVEVIVGGLRPGPSAEVLDDRMAASLRRHWTQVSDRTGQRFDMTFLDRDDGWVYDTEPAAIAVTTMRDISPESTLGYLTSVQHSFYSEGIDVTEFGALVDIAREHVGDVATFAARLETAEAKKVAWADFSRSRNWGIAGFPTLIGDLGDGRLALLARGWAPADQIRDRIASLDGAAGD